LLHKGKNVTLAAYGNSIPLLRGEFPALEIIELPGFSPEYPENGNMMIRLALLIPAFLWSIISEHYRLSRIIKRKQIDVVISDNRYGLWSRKIKSIFISHQVFVRAPKKWSWLNPLLLLVNRLLISRFNECWIPDLAGNDNLSGELSHLHSLPENYYFIGPLTRLQPGNINPSGKNHILAILSGPEPQRSILEKILSRQLKDLRENAVLIRGVFKSDQHISNEGNLTVMNYATTDQVQELLETSIIVICRSGYSIVMDLARVGGKALFIPTPGQTEQEYLSEFLLSKGIALSINQNNLFLQDNLSEAISFKGFQPLKSNSALEERIDLLSCF